MFTSEDCVFKVVVLDSNTFLKKVLFDSCFFFRLSLLNVKVTIVQTFHLIFF